MTQNKTTTELEQEIQSSKNTFAETLQKQKEEYEKALEVKDKHCKELIASRIEASNKICFLKQKNQLIIRFYNLLLEANIVGATIRDWDKPGLLFNKWYIKDKSVLDNFYIRMSKALSIKDEIKEVEKSCNKLCEENDDSDRLDTNFAL